VELTAELQASAPEITNVEGPEASYVPATPPGAHQHKRSYGGSPQRPCRRDELQTLRARVAKDLGVELPQAYYEFLTLMNGLNSNGLTIYASQTTSMAGYEHRKDMNIDGIVEANLVWRDYEPHKRFVMFGQSGTSLYAYDLKDKKYRVLDRQSNSLIEEMSSFQDLLRQALEENAPSLAACAKGDQAPGPVQKSLHPEGCGGRENWGGG
jgi:hypothetical protein